MLTNLLHCVFMHIRV